MNVGTIIKYKLAFVVYRYGYMLHTAATFYHHLKAFVSQTITKYNKSDRNVDCDRCVTYLALGNLAKMACSYASTTLCILGDIIKSINRHVLCFTGKKNNKHSAIHQKSLEKHLHVFVLI